MKTIVISLFPGCESNYVSTENSITIDSYRYSWLINEHGVKVRNPDFPSNYINVIKDCIGKVNVIFVSSHGEVRDALRNNNIPYIYIRPNIDMRDKFVERYIDKGESDSFIEFMYDNWEGFILNDMSDTGTYMVELNESNPYINLTLIDDIFKSVYMEDMENET